MAFVGKTTNVTTVATNIVAPAAATLLQVQNFGTATVTLGGPGVTFGQGVNLPPAMTQPVAIAVAHYGNFQDADDGLYAIVAGGSSNVGVLQPY